MSSRRAVAQRDAVAVAQAGAARRASRRRRKCLQCRGASVRARFPGRGRWPAPAAESGPRSTNGTRALFQHSASGFSIVGIGAVDQRGRRRCARRIVGIERRFRRSNRRYRESRRRRRNAARRRPAHGRCGRSSTAMPSTSAIAADRQRPHGDRLRQAARDDLGGVDRRIAELRQQRQAADMVPVAVAEDERVDPADGRPGPATAPGGGPSPRSSRSRLPASLEQEAGRPLPADAGYEPQRTGAFIHYVSSPYTGMPKAGENRGNIDNRRSHP